MKILYSTDLHGDKNKYNKLLELAINNDIKVIINGGDMLPKQCDRHKEQPLFINDYLRDYFNQLRQHDIKYLAMLGNDDLLSVDKLFNDVCNEFDNVYNIAQSKIIISDYEFIGMNYILDHPFGCKDRVVMEDNYIFQSQLSKVVGTSNENDYDKMFVAEWFYYAKEKLLNMKTILNDLPNPINNQKTIYVIHMPPANLKLGQLLYQDLDIGSVAISDFIKEKQPLLTMHGHIHESPDTKTGTWINTIDNATCIQPGQTELGDSTLIYANIDLDNKEYKREKIKV